MIETRDIIDWIRTHCLHGDAARELTADTALLETGLLDSMQLMQLVSFVEERTGATVPLDDVVPDNFETPARVAALAARLR